MTQPRGGEGRKGEFKLRQMDFRTYTLNIQVILPSPEMPGRPLLGEILQQGLECAKTFAIKNKARSKSSELPVTGGIQSETR